MDGILMSACDKEHNVDLYNKVIERGIPIVFFDRTVEKVKASQVHMDDYIMSFFMVEALLRKGYKHIIHIPGPAYIRNSYERLRGYRDALEKFPSTLGNTFIVHDDTKKDKFHSNGALRHPL